MRCVLYAVEAIDGLRLRLATAEVEALRRDKFDSRGLSAHFKAGTIVWACAILERLFKEYSAELRAAVEAAGAGCEPFHWSLSNALRRGSFQAASEDSRQGLVARATYANAAPCSLDAWPANFSFDDGKTVDAITFESVWIALQLPGDALASSIEREVLKEFKSKRNEVAHGESDVVSVGRTVTFSDLDRKLGQLAEVLERLYVSTVDWVAARGWR